MVGILNWGYLEPMIGFSTKKVKFSFLLSSNERGCLIKVKAKKAKL